jgi:hypothetical protein
MQKLMTGKFHGFRLSEMPATRRLPSTLKWRMRRAFPLYFGRLCLPVAPVLPIAKNEKSGTFSFL